MATISPTADRRHLSDRRTGSSVHLGRHMQALDWTALALMTIGGLNWGLVGLFNFDLVASIFGQMSSISRVIYTLIGLAALYSIYTSSKIASSDRH